MEKEIEIIKKSKDLKKFLNFLEAFKVEEEGHIRKALNPEDEKDFNLRSAGLCNEAYATAQLMVTMLTE
jgi:hypothetical protein